MTFYLKKEPSWVLEYSKNKKRQEDLVRKQELNKRIQMIRKKEKLERQKATYRTVGGNVIQKRLVCMMTSIYGHDIISLCNLYYYNLIRKRIIVMV